MRMIAPMGNAPLDTLGHYQGLSLALAIGFLVGIERGWQERDLQTGARVAGIRTFALIGLLGGIWGALFPIVGGVAVGLAAFAFAIGLTVFEWRESVKDNSLSATDLIAGLVTFALGVFAVLGNKPAAAAAAVVVTGLLALRHPLHAFLRTLTWPELRSALLLLAMTVVLLPVLPDRNIDPWDTVNPHRIWLITVAIAALSFVGYVAVRVAGARRGLLVAGAAGALVSSTAVTLTYSRLSKTEPQIANEAGVAILASWIVSLTRMTTLAIILAPVLLKSLLPAVVAAVFVLLVTAFVLDRSSRHDGTEAKLQLENPVELGMAIRFGLMLGLVTVVSKLFAAQIGELSLLPLAAVTGLADVDPITLSVSQMVPKDVTVAVAAMAILIAAAANGVTKLSLAFSFAPGRVGRILGGAGAVAILAGVAGAIFVRLP
ncbi:MAG TPA: MgtC/SapB family protein [Rhizomicrobium sp.]|nr:MgtC/SapB family protein [Rhizomicrobium sp.]